MLLILIILILMFGWFNHKPIKLLSDSYHHFPASNLSVTAVIKTVSLQKSYRTDLGQAQVLCFDQTINKISGLAFSFSVTVFPQGLQNVRMEMRPPLLRDELKRPMGNPNEILSFPRTTGSLMFIFCYFTSFKLREQNGY